jgi:superfamily II DNA or RNA helicase
LKIFAEQGRQILVLSSRKQHLKDLKENFDNFNYTKIINDQEVPITTGYYMGGMKKMDLEKSAKCDIIYGTFNLVAEGTDIPTLNTLLMACPRKEVEQVVGRILRANTGFIPIVIDIADNFSIFVNQGTYRQRFYKRQKYHIDVFDIDKENYKIVKLKDTKQTEGLKIRRRKKQEEVVFKKLAICIDSDDE